MIRITIPTPPIGYLRMTQGDVRLVRVASHKMILRNLSRWQQVHRYLAYKDAVSLMCRKFVAGVNLNDKITMDCCFYFANGAHPDPDNCWKAISDAIFCNDNKVVGSFDFAIDPENPRTEITLYLEPTP